MLNDDINLSSIPQTGFTLAPEPNDNGVIEGEARVVAGEEEFVPPAPEEGVSDLITHDWSQQRVLLPVGATKDVAVQVLTKTLPRNEYGLPTGFIRSDLLPYDLGLLCQGDVDAAVVKLDYAEGYPTTPKGALFWSCLDHEPPQAYGLFQKFLDQPNDIGIRQLEVLAQMQNYDLGKIMEYYREFHWSVRAKSFDLFQVAADKKRREFRIRNTENKHFLSAERLVEELMPFFNDPDWINNLSPLEAIEVFEKLVKIQRLSLGLTGQNSSSFAAPGGGETVEVIMRQLIGQGGGNGQTGEMGADLAALMADPEFGMKAQELIIRATRGSTPITTNDEAALG